MEVLSRYARATFVGSGYLVGRFDCPPGEHAWREVNDIGSRAHVVLPGTAVLITAEGADPHVTTPNEALVYDRGVRYRRRLVDGAGDRCDFVAVEDELADRLGLADRAGSPDRPGPAGRQPGPARGRPRLRRVPVSAGNYGRHRFAVVDELSLDECYLTLLHDTARQLSPADRSRPARVLPNQRAAVEEVIRILALRLVEPLSLAEVAAAVHYSPYALARLFRRLTGYSVHEFRQQLRLRRSLDDALRPGSHLSTVAHDYGFSSHSHYTSAFRRAFGCTPGQARAGRLPTNSGRRPR
jgi:AraC-like DNA-binding protein